MKSFFLHYTRPYPSFLSPRQVAVHHQKSSLEFSVSVFPPPARLFPPSFPFYAWPKRALASGPFLPFSPHPCLYTTKLCVPGHGFPSPRLMHSRTPVSFCTRPSASKRTPLFDSAIPVAFFFPSPPPKDPASKPVARSVAVEYRPFPPRNRFPLRCKFQPPVNPRCLPVSLFLSPPVTFTVDFFLLHPTPSHFL